MQRCGPRTLIRASQDNLGYQLRGADGPGEFVRSRQAVTASMRQAISHFDAIWNHDDDQGIGVLAAINVYQYLAQGFES